MIGCYDFCGHFEWTFGWLERLGGAEAVREYWRASIDPETQALIARAGFAGMEQYWGHTLLEESPSLGYAVTSRPDVFRLDIHDCPSRGFLLRNGLKNYSDYCDHCMGWIGPMLRDCGFTVDHEHNHAGQCWWEMRPVHSPRAATAPGATAGAKDVRFRPEWSSVETPIDRFVRSNDPADKQPAS